MQGRNGSLEDEFKGRKAGRAELADNGWHDQGGANHHYGFEQKKGLWLKSFDTQFPCDCHPIKLFVLLQFDRSSKISAIGTQVHHIFPDGGFHRMETGFFGPDLQRARAMISEVLTPGEVETSPKQSIKSEKRDAADPSAPPPVEIARLVKLLDKREGSPAFKKFIKEYSIKGVQYPFGIGIAWKCPDDRLELKVTEGVVEAVFVKKIGAGFPEDLLSKGTPLHNLRRADLLKIYGRPTNSDPDGWWDRFDNEKALMHFQYNKTTGALVQVTIMSTRTMI